MITFLTLFSCKIEKTISVSRMNMNLTVWQWISFFFLRAMFISSVRDLMSFGQDCRTEKIRLWPSLPAFFNFFIFPFRGTAPVILQYFGLMHAGFQVTASSHVTDDIILKNSFVKKSHTSMSRQYICLNFFNLAFQGFRKITYDTSQY